MAKSDSTRVDSERPGWIVILVVGVILLLALVNLYAQLNYSLRGTQEPGRILATEGGIGKMRSVTARVQVFPRNAPPISVEVEDTLGVHGWKEGDALPMLCTHLHADHLSCVADLWLDRYAFPLGVLSIAALLGWAIFRRRRKTAPAPT